MYTLLLTPCDQSQVTLCLGIHALNQTLTLLLILQGQSQAAASAVAAAVALPNANAGVIIQALAQTVRGCCLLLQAKRGQSPVEVSFARPASKCKMDSKGVNAASMCILCTL